MGTLEGPRDKSRRKTSYGADLNTLGEQMLAQKLHVLICGRSELPPPKSRHCQKLFPNGAGRAPGWGPRWFVVGYRTVRRKVAWDQRRPFPHQPGQGPSPQIYVMGQLCRGSRAALLQARAIGLESRQETLGVHEPRRGEGGARASAVGENLAKPLQQRVRFHREGSSMGGGLQGVRGGSPRRRRPRQQRRQRRRRRRRRHQPTTTAATTTTAGGAATTARTATTTTRGRRAKQGRKQKGKGKGRRRGKTGRGGGREDDEHDQSGARAGAAGTEPMAPDATPLHITAQHSVTRPRVCVCVAAHHSTTQRSTTHNSTSHSTTQHATAQHSTTQHITSHHSTRRLTCVCVCVCVCV